MALYELLRCNPTSSMIAYFAVLPALGLRLFRGEVDQLDEGASDVNGNVADELCVLMW